MNKFYRLTIFGAVAITALLCATSGAWDINQGEFVAFIQDKSQTMRAQALCYIRMTAWNKLGWAKQSARLLKDEKQAVRMEALRVLSNAQDPAIIPQIVAVGREHPKELREFVRALHRLDHPAAIPYLEEFAKNKDAKVAKEAQKGLRNLLALQRTQGASAEPPDAKSLNHSFIYPCQDLFPEWLQAL